MESWSEKSACPGQCSHCTGDHLPPAQGLAGWRLVLLSAGVFLAPIVLGIAGSKVVRGGATEQFVGAATGIVTGLTIAAILSRCVRPRGKGSSRS